MTKTALRNSVGIFEPVVPGRRADSTSSPKYLFVYGTLRRNHTPPEMADLMRSLEWIGKGSVPGRIYDLGDYPGAIFDQTSTNEIQGEIYKLPTDGKALEKLDEYEEFRPSRPNSSLFVRVCVPVRVKRGKRLNCWAYRFNPKKKEKSASRKTKGRTPRSKSSSAAN